MLSVTSLFANNLDQISGIIKGTVITTDNKPAASASVHLKGTRMAKLTNDKGIFIPAQGIISNNKIKLRIPDNEKIIRVVYGWKPFTRANLVNEAGLPASTFSISINAKEK